MKKLYTLILSITLFTGTKAQLSLTKAINEPVVGDVNIKNGFDSVGVVPKNTGAAQTWNFSSFTSNTVVAISTYTTVASTPSAASFPLATIAEDQGGGSFNYYQSTASTFELNGIATNGIAITFTNNAIAAQWPIIYLYSNTDVFAGSASTPIGNGPANGTITTTAPGNGTVMLPGGQTFTNALQVKATNNIKAVVGTFPITATITVVGTDYTYYSSAQKFALITVSYSKQTITPSVGSPTVNSTATIRINSQVYAGINELTFDNSYSVYPNPTSGVFTIELSNPGSENVSVEILNQLGQVVRREELGNNAIKTSINIQGINSGVYFVRTNLGNKSSVKKLIVNN
jgi:hypothetical protein